jgi:dGTPase
VDYSPFDRERFVTETHSSKRGDFQRDRGRIIHSSALRRLAQKTQVLSPTSGVDFARNRLTHSLEVAQVGREIALRLGLDPDVVDGACLAHDLGHPPFGHNGEAAIASWAASIGGFEGNAQTFRVLTRLESKVADSSGVSRGLNLSRASLDAASKYPWDRHAALVEDGGREKFGVYADDQEVFDWLRHGLPEREVSIEAQVMDLADDIAYSVHDFEDAIVGGFIKPAGLVEWVEDSERAVNWEGQQIAAEELRGAFGRLREMPTWPASFTAERASFAQLKNFTSSAIGRFAQTVTVAERGAGDALSGRYRFGLYVPVETQAEIAVLKSVVATAVMKHETRQPIYAHQREVLVSLLETLMRTGAEHLEPMYQADFAHAGNDEGRARVIVDQVASLTDQSALAWHERLVG